MLHTGCTANYECGENGLCISGKCGTGSECLPPSTPNGKFNRMDHSWGNKPTLSCDRGYILKEPGMSLKVSEG